MKRLLLILLALASLQCAFAATVREVILRDTTDRLMIPVDRNTMLDLYDYYDAGQHVYAKTQNSEEVEIDSITDNYICISTSRVSLIQAWLAKAGSDSIVVVSTTYETKPHMSIVRAYNAQSFDDITDKVFTPLTLDDFIAKGTTKAKRAELMEKIPGFYVVYSIDASTGDIFANHHTNECFTKEDYDAIKPYLVEERHLVLKGRKYRLAK
ncbi:MAG: DUF3256 family protein [Muribaculaceae bacterium]